MKQKVGFRENESIADYQEMMSAVYSIPDDRAFSISDLLSHQARFTMRALKGIRKGDMKKLKNNLVVSLSWVATISNRLHIDMQAALWRRFPHLCSYCGSCPCLCKREKIIKRAKVNHSRANMPKTMQEFQKMFQKIYPPKNRSLADAGIHLAEETGEMTESIHNFLGQHKRKQFESIELEIADWISCMFGLANSACFDLASESAKYFASGCHICHHTPCSCNFSYIADFKS